MKIVYATGFSYFTSFMAAGNVFRGFRCCWSLKTIDDVTGEVKSIVEITIENENLRENCKVVQQQSEL
jgi:hypothetical protein